MMLRKMQMLWWYAKRPRLWPYCCHLVGQRLRGQARYDSSAEQQAAQEWCAEHAVTAEEAFAACTGGKALANVRERFPERFAQAQARRDACPVTMGGPGALDLLYASVDHLQATRVVETGVAYGWSSLALLLSLAERPQSQLISIDMPYELRNNDTYVGCVVPDDLRASWRILECADRQGLPRALRLMPEIDCCHYDSDKAYTGRMWSYPRLWQALRPGGWFISDDIGDNLAFRDFAQQHSRRPWVIHAGGKYIGILVK